MQIALELEAPQRPSAEPQEPPALCPGCGEPVAPRSTWHMSCYHRAPEVVERKRRVTRQRIQRLEEEAERHKRAHGLLDAADLAAELGVTRKTIYKRTRQLDVGERVELAGGWRYLYTAEDRDAIKDALRYEAVETNGRRTYRLRDRPTCAGCGTEVRSGRQWCPGCWRDRLPEVARDTLRARSQRLERRGREAGFAAVGRAQLALEVSALLERPHRLSGARVARVARELDVGEQLLLHARGAVRGFTQADVEAVARELASAPKGRRYQDPRYYARWMIARWPHLQNRTNGRLNATFAALKNKRVGRRCELDDYAIGEIRRLHASGHSQRAIARIVGMGISRDQVQRLLAGR